MNPDSGPSLSREIPEEATSPRLSACTCWCFAWRRRRTAFRQKPLSQPGALDARCRRERRKGSSLTSVKRASQLHSSLHATCMVFHAVDSGGSKKTAFKTPHVPGDVPFSSIKNIIRNHKNLSTQHCECKPPAVISLRHNLQPEHLRLAFRDSFRPLGGCALYRRAWRSEDDKARGLPGMCLPHEVHQWLQAPANPKRAMNAT